MTACCCLLAVSKQRHVLTICVHCPPHSRSTRRLFLLDYDGTLLPQSSISTKPSKEVLDILRGLTADTKNDVFIISGRGRGELGDWFASVVRRCLPTTVSCPAAASAEVLKVFSAGILNLHTAYLTGKQFEPQAMLLL
jgi:hypothetical protein